MHTLAIIANAHISNHSKQERNYNSQMTINFGSASRGTLSLNSMRAYQLAWRQLDEFLSDFQIAFS